MKRRFAGAPLAVLLLAAGAAMAHHSAAMFDSQKQVELQGTVKDFLWINPHCFIQLTVKGTNESWMIEMGSTKQLYQAGWRPGTLKAGDQLTVVAHPERDGSRSALFRSATRGDGKPVVGDGAP